MLASLSEPANYLRGSIDDRCFDDLLSNFGNEQWLFQYVTSQSMLWLRMSTRIWLRTSTYKQWKGEFVCFFIASMLLNSQGSIHQGHRKLPPSEIFEESEILSILNHSAGIALALGLSWNVKRHTNHKTHSI